MTVLHNQIRVRIGYNSEKSLNNSPLLKSLEVENKSATPYSSKRLVKAQTNRRLKLPLPSFSFSFRLLWALTRTKKNRQRRRKDNENSAQRKDVDIIRTRH
jgi:hypothetical protein